MKIEMEWTSVNEKLPTYNEWLKDKGWFLVSDGEKAYIRRYDMRYKKFGRYLTYRKPVFEETFCTDFAVVEWMPLPNPSKEK